MNSDFDAYEKKDTEILNSAEGSENEASDSVSESEAAGEIDGERAKNNGSGRTEIVGIRFRKNGKTYYFAPGDFKLSRDDRVIVDTARGQEYGYTAVPNRMINDSEIVAPLRRVVRMAENEDTAIHEENLRREIEAFNSCIVLIDENKLEMKLIDVELSFDRSKLMFYFSAEGRVDFRDLVKELAGKFKTRIEMRQIGIRDEAKILGGLGVCGRPFCCSSFLSDFVQVSVKMAKEQNLSLNSAKISGACGRLMCCLRYEYDTYLAEKALTPKVDTRVMTPEGAGVVTAANPLAGIVKVKLDKSSNDNEQVAFVREDVVKEDEYKGEKLVKSAIPERKHKEDNDDPFGFDVAFGAAPERSEQSSVNETAREQKQHSEPSKVENKVQDGKRQNGMNGKREDGKNRNENGKEKRADGEHAQNAPSEGRPNQNGKKKNNHHNRQKHDRDRRDMPDNRQNARDTEKNDKVDRSDKPERNERKAPQNDARRSDKPASQNTEKKKHFRPYYKNHKKNNKNRTGEAQDK